MNEIRIVKFINPNYFFYYNKIDGDKLSEINKTEEKLKKTLQHNQEYVQKPEIGKIYALLNEHSNNWIRVEVKSSILRFESEIQYIVWCFDYGILAHTTSNELLEIPEDLQQKFDLIKVGSMLVTPPDKLKYNISTKQIEQVPQTEWSASTISICHEMIKSFSQIYFEELNEIDGIRLGILFDNNKCNLIESLVNSKIMKVENFELNYKKDQIFISETIDFEEASHEIQKIQLEQKIDRLQVIKINKLLSANIFQNSSTNPQKPEESQISKLSDCVSDESINNSKISEKLPSVFVHGNSARPLSSLTEMVFPNIIKQNLNRIGFRSIWTMQSYSWPNIQRGISTFIISGKNTGKSFCYLPIILSEILDKNEEGSGPIAIIIANSSKDVDHLHKVCYNIVRPNPMKIISATGSINLSKKLEEMLLGCHLLITTPSCFVRFIENDSLNPFDKKRIRHLIFDDLDLLTIQFNARIHTIIKICSYRIDGNLKNPQIIVTSKIWNKTISTIAKFANDPVIIFGCFVEASLFAKCKFKVNYHSSLKMKCKSLMDLISEYDWRMKKTLIVANNEHLVRCVHSLLVRTCDDPIELKIISEDFKIEKRDTKSYLYLTSDDVIEKLNQTNFMNDFEYLIHFKMPSKWSQFSMRFLSMMESFKSSLKGEINELKVYCLLDNENSSELIRIFKFLKTHEVLKDSSIIEKVENVVKEMEIEKMQRELELNEESHKNKKICSRILSFGECKAENCLSRHTFSPTDAKNKLKIQGPIKFEIVETLSPTNFIIKILESYSIEDKKMISHVKTLKKIEDELENMQKLERIHQSEFKVNDICAALVRIGKFSRCKILKISDKIKDPKKPKKVEILLIDEGKVIRVGSDEICVLPENLQNLQPKVTSLRVLNLVPFDFDYHWSSEVTHSIRKTCQKYSNQSDYSFCNVSFTLNDEIFTENIYMMKFNSYANVEQTSFALKKHLIKEKLCIEDKSVENKFKNLLTNAGISFNEENSTNLMNKRKVEKQTETVEIVKAKSVPPKKILSQNSEYQVYLRYLENPNLFYVIVDRSNNKTLNSLIEKVENYQIKQPIIDVKLNEIYLYEINGKLQRCKIFGIHENLIKIFMIDEGVYKIVTKDEIYECPNELIELFPSQAVKCQLLGIQPIFSKEWNESESNSINKFLIETCSDKQIKMKVIKVTNENYEVLLYHPTNGQRLDEIVVNMRIAIKSIVEFPTEEQETFEESVEITITKKTENLSQSEEVQDIPENSKSISTKTESIQENPSSIYKLKLIAKHPRITWRENCSIIYLEISAVDSNYYYIEIEDTKMKIFISYKNSEEMTSILFYNFIDENLASYEKAGEKIIVRLPKKFKGLWPRITFHNETNQFIKKSCDDLEFIEKILSKNQKYGVDEDDDDENIRFNDTDDEDTEYNEFGCNDLNENIHEMVI